MSAHMKLKLLSVDFDRRCMTLQLPDEILRTMTFGAGEVEVYLAPMLAPPMPTIPPPPAVLKPPTVPTSSSGGGQVRTPAPILVDFTSPSLVSNLKGADCQHTRVEPTLFEAQWRKNESAFGFVRRVTIKKEIFVRMEVLFGKDFDAGMGMKLFRLTSIDKVKQVNKWDLIVQFNSEGEPFKQAGTNDIVEVTISRNSGDTYGRFRKTFERGKKYSIEYHVRLNTGAGVKDGLFQMFVDGGTLFNLTKIDLTGPVWSDQIDDVTFGGWYSNGAGGNPNPDPEPGPNILQVSNASYSPMEYP